MARADAKNSNPGTSRIEVGCHSVTRAGTPALVDEPVAYTHEWPEGREARREDTHRRDDQRLTRLRPTVVEIFERRQADHQRSEEERAVQIRPDRDDHRREPQPPRMLAPTHDQQQDADEAEHPEELRAGPGRCDDERQQRQDRRRPDVKAAADGDERRPAEDRPDQQGPECGQPDPPPTDSTARRTTLGAPLLVEPGLSGVNVQLSAVGTRPDAEISAPARS